MLPKTPRSPSLPHIIQFLLLTFWENSGLSQKLTCTLSDPSGYIFTWLIGYSALLGSIAGVMLADYFVLRRGRLNVPELYRLGGEYHGIFGFRWRSLIALAIGIAPSIPGFLKQVGIDGLERLPDFLERLYPYAWFVGLAGSAIAHLLMHAPQLFKNDKLKIN